MDRSLLRGQEVARLFHRSWRDAPPPIPPPEAPSLYPLVLDLGGAGLIAGRLPTGAAPELERTWRMERLQSQALDGELFRLLSALEAAGVPCLALKGWTLARRYPQPGLRPYGDLDLCVAPHQLPELERVMSAVQPRVPVDLHSGFPEAPYSQPFEELWERSLPQLLHGREVRTLGAEDELRLLCIHFLLHGGWRPLWLCDIALAVESLPSDFDWERCLGPHSRFREWVLAVVALSGDLLGATLPDTPAASAPSWMRTAILQQWGRGPGASSLGPLRANVGKASWRTLLARHWRNPVQATAELRAPLTGWPRLPLQLAATARRLPVLWRRPSPPSTSN